MRCLALLLAPLLAASPAFAQPPQQGSTHTFVDPVYGGTVFCDTLAQVRRIATAARPVEVYQALMQTANDRNEPTCLAMQPTGLVLAVIPLGEMKRDDHRFHAWAVETEVSEGHGYALYLEEIEEILV